MIPSVVIIKLNSVSYTISEKSLAIFFASMLFKCFYCVILSQNAQNWLDFISTPPHSVLCTHHLLSLPLSIHAAEQPDQIILTNSVASTVDGAHRLITDHVTRVCIVGPVAD